MSKNFDENARVKIPAILHLTRLSYKYISFKNAVNQIDKDTNIYKSSFGAALNKINAVNLSDADVDFIIRDIKNLLTAEDLGKKFYEKLQSGISFNDDNIHLIDFEHCENNIFEIMTEVPYQSGKDSFRPDITIFINGLPLAFVEVKIPDNKEGIQAEYNRMNERFKQEKYRRFVNITQLMVFSNNSEYDDNENVPLEGAFYAASDYEKLFFNRFREENTEIYNQIEPLNESIENQILKDVNYISIKSTPEYETNKNSFSPTNKILTSLFSRERIIFILKYAFAYVEDSTSAGIKTIQKHIMRYQQMFAEFGIRKMLEQEVKHGVIWHTQGSGKTALAYYSVKYLTDYYQKQNFATQFYFIVDRLDLAQQSAKEFRKRGLEVNEISSKENFVDTIRRSGNMGTTGKLSINVVNIQKFSDESITKDSDFNVNIQRVYFIDEAHRDYKWAGSFLARLMKSDRNAVMIALTGTPLIGEYKTRDIFGKYIHCYYYNQSIADGYTLRLIREGIKTEYRLKLQEVLLKLEKRVEKGTLKKKEIYYHKNYVSPLVDYIEEDFAESRERLNDSTIGAMIVCDSSEQAQAVCNELKERGKFKAELILYDEENVETKRTNFKRGEVDILVVFQMLLTGFDAPRLKKLYLGRKIKEHNLLQALTRVNRPYKKMRYGYVVDFADIQSEFDKTNQAYLRELQEELGEDFSSYQKIFKTQEEIEEDLTFIKDMLFQFNTDNAEEFRKEIQAIEDKKFLLKVRRAIDLYKECYNLAENYGYTDLKEKFDITKIFELSKVVNNRLSLLNQKAAFNNTEDISSLISLAMENIEFNFRKVSEQEMQIADSFLDVRRKTCREFEINADKKDFEYLALLDELRRILGKYNIEEMTSSEMQTEKIELGELRKKIHNLNEMNSRLTARYNGDKKFMRIHKRLAVKSEFTSPTKLYQMLITLKNSVDDMILTNYAVIDNKAYFERELCTDLKAAMKNFEIRLTAAAIRSFGEVIAQEYIVERNSTS